MIPENRIPTHPGEVLREDFLLPLGLTASALGKHMGVPASHISELSQEKRDVTPKLAWLLAQAFGTSPEFWANLQSAHDLAKSRPRRRTKTVRRLTATV